MKTNLINIGLHGEGANIKKLTGQFAGDAETKQYATYSVTDGIATITALTPVYGRVLNLPLPFVLAVNDLGSGLLQSIDINADTLRAYPATCPKQSWADRRSQQPAPSIAQTLMADYIGLL